MTALRIVIVCILNISLIAATAVAQIPWNSYTPEMGFPSSLITCVGFSPSGILWLGTDNGLYRYDGSRTDIFTTNDGLPSNSISSIAFTRSGGIWVGTTEYQPYTGITRFNGSEWEPLVVAENDIAGSASKVTTDSLGNLWAIRDDLSNNPHVWTYNGKQWKYFWFQDGLSYSIIDEVSVAPDGSVWCLDVNSGVYRYDGTQWISIPAPSNYHFSSMGKITFGQENDVWLFGDYWESSWVSQPAIWVSQGATGIWQKYADTIPVQIYSMAVDRSGALWCLYYSPNGNELYRTRDHQKTFILNDIDCFALGKDGTVWAAGGRRGIGRFNGTEWKWYTRSDGLLSNDFSCITVGPDGKVWAAVKPFSWNGYVDGGICCFDGKEWKTYSDSRQLMYPDIKSLAVGPDGTVWAATTGGTRYGIYKGGVSYYNDSSWKTLTEKEGLLYNKVNSLSLDSDDNLWVGTGAGVSHFDGTYWRNYTNTQGLTSYDVSSVAIDNQGTVWAYSPESGLFRQNKTTEMWESIESPPYDYYGTLVMGSGSDIWLGAWNLYRYDGSSWTKYPAQSARSLIFGFDQRPYAAGYMGIIRVRSDGIPERFPGIPTSDFTLVTADPFGDIWYCISSGFFRLDTTVTSVSKTGASPIPFAITGNYPNPFNPSTTISFTIPTPGLVTLTVYDVTGQKMRTLLFERMTAGTHAAVWDGKDDDGKIVSSGMYLSRLTAGKQTATGKMLLMR